MIGRLGCRLLTFVSESWRGAPRCTILGEDLLCSHDQNLRDNGELLH